MKKSALKYFGFKSFIAISLVFPLPALAWVPCQPFCDAGCGGAAISALGNSVASGMSNLVTLNQQLLNNINSVNQTVVNLGVDVSDTWVDAGMDAMSGLSARTAKLELAENQQVKVLENMTNYSVNSYVQAVKELFTAKSVEINKSYYSSQSQPETGTILANASGNILTTYLKTHEQAEQISNVQQQYGSETELGGRDIAGVVKLAIDEDVYRSAVQINRRVLSDQETNNLQHLLTYMSNPDPLPALTDEDLATLKNDPMEYELKRKSFNAKSLMVQTIVNEIIASKTQFDDASWVRSYFANISSSPGLSMMETFSGLINGRVSSEGWFLNIKLLNDSGLLRERVFLKAEENALLFMIMQRREWRNQLLALLNTEA